MNDNGPILAAILSIVLSVAEFNAWIAMAVGIVTLLFILFQIITGIAKRREEHAKRREEHAKRQEEEEKRREEHAEHLKRMEAADRAKAKDELEMKLLKKQLEEKNE